MQISISLTGAPSRTPPKTGRVTKADTIRAKIEAAKTALPAEQRKLLIAWFARGSTAGKYTNADFKKAAAFLAKYDMLNKTPPLLYRGLALKSTAALAFIESGKLVPLNKSPVSWSRSDRKAWSYSDNVFSTSSPDVRLVFKSRTEDALLTPKYIADILGESCAFNHETVCASRTLTKKDVALTWMSEKFLTRLMKAGHISAMPTLYAGGDGKSIKPVRGAYMVFTPAGALRPAKPETVKKFYPYVRFPKTLSIKVK